MRKKKILVIDDDSMNLQIAKMVLEKKLKCEVLCVDNGPDGVELMRRQHVDLLLLDIFMPDVDGIETLEKIRADSQIKEIPVMMLTASGSPDNIHRVSELGVRDYIKKPFMPEDLAERVRKKLEQIHGEKILIVGDNQEELLEIQVLIEENFPHDALIASSTAEAQEILSTNDIKLVIASANMKFLDGFELLALMASDEKFGAIPFTLTSDKKLLELITKINPPKVQPVTVQPATDETAPPLATHAHKQKFAHVVTSAIGYKLNVRI